jgi:hypothetical protein
MMGLRCATGIMVVLIWLVLLLQSSMVSSNCFAEPVGIGECGLDSTNATAEPTNATYYTARFGIPTNNKKNGNSTTTAAADGVPQVKYCRYAWQVIKNDQGFGTTSFGYSTLDSNALTASDPDCTDDCSAVVSSHFGTIFTEPTTVTIRHRFYVLPILEGQEKDDAATMDWNPFPKNPSENQPPKSGTLHITADGCTYDEWDPVPTSTPSISPPPTSPPSPPPTTSPSPPTPTSPPLPLASSGGVAPTNPPPLDSSGGGVATTSCWMWTTAVGLWPVAWSLIHYSGSG